jgi:hypothetical protein
MEGFGARWLLLGHEELPNGIGRIQILVGKAVHFDVAQISF